MAVAYIPLLVVGRPAKSTNRYLAGKTLIDSQPCSRFVVVQDRKTLRFIAGTLSDPETGEWQISGLPEMPEKSLLVTSIDLAGESNAEIFDSVSLCTEE